MISRILGNSRKQICVEADTTVWEHLQRALDENDCATNVFKGALSSKSLAKSKKRKASPLDPFHFDIIHVIH